MFSPFFYLLRDIGLPVSFQYIMEFYQAFEKGLITDLKQLFLVTRLICVKKVEHYELFERAFSAYFLGQEDALDVPNEVHEALIDSKPFQEWLAKELEAGNLTEEEIRNLSLPELLERFWETLLAQNEEHHGGNRWIGTGGTSLWGHSGRAKGGIRVHGASLYRSAVKVIGQHRYTNYSADSDLRSENIRQALAMMKLMLPTGPCSEINVEKTIEKTCKNGGEIELIFDRQMLDRIKVILLLDNGGYSMTPFVRNVRTLFSKMKDQFKDLEFYYFHNCIYENVYTDPQRSQTYSLEKITEKDKDTRVFIVGDANMGPSELFSAYGAIDYYSTHKIPGIDCLQLLAETFPYTVWLNPLDKKYWPYQSVTITAIAKIFRMESLTLNGLKNAVEYLNSRS